jgi:hypothetical protein
MQVITDEPLVGVHGDPASIRRVTVVATVDIPPGYAVDSRGRPTNIAC